VERIPREWIEQVRRRLQAGREFQDGLQELLTADTELADHLAGTGHRAALSAPLLAPRHRPGALPCDRPS